MITNATSVHVEELPWGTIAWLASGEIGNTSTMTFGKVTIRPGKCNALHYHPNCDEILHVLEGQVAHVLGEDIVDLGPGDTLCIPSGTVHNATSVGTTDAVMIVAFSAPDRLAVMV